MGGHALTHGYGGASTARSALGGKATLGGKLAVGGRVAVEGAVHGTARASYPPTTTPTISSTSTHAASTIQGSAHARAGLSSSTSASTAGPAGKGALMAAKGGVVLKALAVASVGVAGLVVAAHTGAVPNLGAALSGVPLWTHAQSLLAQLQAGIQGGASGGFNLGR